MLIKFYNHYELVIVFYFHFIGMAKLIVASLCDVFALVHTVSSMWMHLSAATMWNGLSIACFLG